MPRQVAAVAFATLLVAATLALAQSAPTPQLARQPGVEPTLVQGTAAAAPEGSRARADADARECLEYLTNTGVIRCAERYRHPGARPAH